MFGGPKLKDADKFTLEHFRRGAERPVPAPQQGSVSNAPVRSLNEVLVKHAIVTDGNKDVLVETFRAMAELLTWGDQHEPAIFDYFVEKRMLAHFVRILVQCTPAAAPTASAPVAAGVFTGVAVQLLQSLSILVQNTRRETSIYYLFSNNYINDLMELKQFDFGVDEEVLAWYISFLKAISLRLNERTIQFFVSDAPEAVLEGAGGKRRNEAAAGNGAHLVPAAFSLYTQVIRYVQHQDSMVRAAARVATLNVFQVNDPAARNFVLLGPERGYFSTLAASLLEQSRALSVLLSTLPARWPAVATGVAKLGDLLCYCNDVLDLDIDGISSAMSQALWQDLVTPLLAALPDAPEVDSASDGPALTPVAALFVLSRLCHSLTYRPLLTKLIAALLGVSEGVKRRRCILDVVGVCSQRDLAASALCLLAVLASNQFADDAALDAAGLLPIRRRKKARLLNVLTAEPAAVQPAIQDESANISSEDPPSSEVPAIAPDAFADDADLGSSANCRAARREITDALSRFFHACSHVVGYADLQALSTAAWLLKELAEPSEEVPASASARNAEDGRRSSALATAEQSCLLHEAAASATAGLRDLLPGPWGDAVAPLLCSQWGLASRVAQAPALGDEHVAAQILYSAADVARTAAEAAAEAPAASSPTAPCAERALLAVRRWVVLHSLCTLFCGEGKLGAAPQLAAPPDGYVCTPSELREGSAAPAIALEGVPCRVAFERGKERNVLLSVAASGVTLPSPSDAAGSCFTANVLLVEAAKARGGSSGASTSGVVHAVAPAAGAEPYVDAAHRKWLHLRVRPSVGTLLACAALPPAPGAAPWAPGWAPPPPLSAARRLQDGHWTLAFASEEVCLQALECVREQTQLMREVCGGVLDRL